MKNRLTECISLYREVFGDSRKLTEQVFFCENNLIDYKYDVVDEKVVAVVFARKKTLRVGDQVIDIPFMFGIATHKDFRHQGKSSKLINEMFGSLKQKGYKFTMLCPANEGLYKFYNQFGFKKFNKVYSEKLGNLIKSGSEFIKVENDEQIHECVDLFKKYNEEFIVAQVRQFVDMKNRILEIAIDGGAVYLLKKDSFYGYIVINGDNKIEEVISLYKNKNENIEKCSVVDLNQEIFIQKGCGKEKNKEVIKILDNKGIDILFSIKGNKIAFYEEW